MKNILQSLKVVKKKLKGKFDYEQMEQDIKMLVRIWKVILVICAPILFLFPYQSLLSRYVLFWQKNSIDKVTFAMYDLKHKLNHIKHINKLWKKKEASGHIEEDRSLLDY